MLKGKKFDAFTLSKVILLPIRYVICIFINKQVDIYSLAKL